LNGTKDEQLRSWSRFEGIKKLCQEQFGSFEFVDNSVPSIPSFDVSERPKERLCEMVNRLDRAKECVFEEVKDWKVEMRTKAVQLRAPMLLSS
jgi:hypothetical protein